jgi:pimeloyl-ACP methyl ester carboxylesterase
MTNPIFKRKTMPIYFEENSSKNPETLIFLHGGGAGAWMWRKTVQLLPDFHCLVPDLPEHDHSADIKPFTMNGAALAVADLIRQHAHGGKAHVVGLSLGAQVGVEMLKTAAEVLKSGFLSSPIMKPMPGTSLGFYSEGVMRWSHRLFMKPLDHWDWWIRLNMKYAAGIPAEYFPESKRIFQTMSEDAWTHIMMAGMTFRMPAGLENVKTRTLVAAGKSEYGSMRESVRMLAHTLPNALAYLINIPGHSGLAESHNWALTAPELFAASVRAWVTGKALPAELKKMD